MPVFPTLSPRLSCVLRCLVVSSALLGPAAAHAAECSALKLAATVDIVAGPTVPLVPVLISGVPKHLIVDTGGYVSALYPATVRELALETGTARGGTIDIAGKISRTTVRIPELTLGRLRAANLRFSVTTDEDKGDIPSGAPAGLLSPDILQNYDVDFDFAANKLNLFDPDHCPGKVVYWQAAKVAVVPFRLDRSFHMVFSATVDGRRVEAMLDTGASNTTLDLALAKSAFKVDVNALDVEKVGELQAKSFSTNIYRRRFKSVALEGVEVTNPFLMLIPDLIRGQFAQGPATGSLLPDRNQQTGLPDLTIGMSVLSQMHVYIAYKEKKLYITSAGTPPP